MAKRVYTPEQQAAKKAREAEYYRENREKIRARQEAYFAAHPGRRAEIAKKSKEKHRETINEKERARYEANKEHVSRRVAEYRKANPEAHKARQRAYQQRNAERLREYRRAHYEANREHYRAIDREWRKANKEKKRTYWRERMANEPQVRLARALRTRLNMAISREYRAGSAVRDLGCSIAELCGHLEAQFLPGMSWENYGPRGWHIDHIVPLSSFDLTDRGQLLVACNFENLRPLWAADNLSKGAKLDQ